MFHADLHIHSRFSRACSKDCDLPKLAWWAARKGIAAIGTGDFTHPGWAAEIAECLVPAEPGLLRLRGDIAPATLRDLPPSCRAEPRFILSAEISTIYSRDGVTRKVHHLIYAPTFEAAGKITAALAKTGNLASDGRPILGLDSRHLLEITLSGGPGCFLVPAHIWTPWFAVLGSKSGFDTVAECYLDLADQVFAVETGLSSDPPMNWMFSGLDRYRLVSNSDAHSPPMLGREATTFSTELDYFAIATALRTGEGLAGTLNFFPEGGRYHLDGHRKCGVRLTPEQSVTHGGMCPECGKPLTIGVLHRVTELADRPEGTRPPEGANYSNLVSLPEIVGEINHVGPKSKKAAAEVDRLAAALGPELHILCDAETASIQRVGGSLLAEAVARLRRGQVIKEPGYDGEYGVIRLFQPAELERAAALFDIPSPARPPAAETTGGTARSEPGTRGTRRREPGARGLGPAGGPPRDGPAQNGDQPQFRQPPTAIVWGERKPGSGGLMAGLDPDQRAAAEAAGPLMIIAGPGTGKTATLTHRIAADVTQRGVPPRGCLALTFTRRAAEEMRQRLARLIPAHASDLTVTTFHGLGLAILRENAGLAGLTSDFTVAGDTRLLEVVTGHTGSQRAARELLAAAAADPARRAELNRLLTARDVVGFDGLVELPVALMNNEPHVAAALRERWRSISVDEYQDIDASQYALLRLLAGDGRGLTVIGDPDQAIYGFRGADVGFFLRFGRDYPGASTVHLTRNYRSSPAIVTSALQAVAPATLVPGRVLRPVSGDGHPGEAGGEAPATVTVHEATDENAEAGWVAASIDRLLGGSSFHSLDSGRAEGHAGGRLSLADVAVLYRTDAQAGVLGQGLTHAGLPFQKRSHDLLLRRPAVPEIVHQLRLAAGRQSPPRAGVTDSPPEGMAGGPGGTAAGVAERLARVVRELAGRPRGDGAAAVDVLTAGEVLTPLALRCGDDLERFLSEVALGAEPDALDPRADVISLLTLHAAKGLEFKAVFIAGCERGLMPLWRGGLSTDSAEERRLLFVGMTRAKEHLFLTYASHRRQNGSDLPTGPSPFLKSISPALITRPTPTTPRRPPSRQLRLL